MGLSVMCVRPSNCNQRGAELCKCSFFHISHQNLGLSRLWIQSYFVEGLLQNIYPDKLAAYLFEYIYFL